MSSADATTPSIRSLVSGFVLALLLCGVNSYLTLSFGVIEEGPTIAALLFFATFFLSSVKIRSHEMVMVATMGSAGGSLGFITNFYAAEAMVGAPYSFWQMVGFSTSTSLVGMAFVVPLRQLLILRESLPWPGSKATESVIRALVEKGDPKQPLYLLAAGALCLAWVLANTDGGFGLVPDATEIPLLGLAAFGLAIAWSPFAIGGAYLMGFRACVGFLVGGIALLVMAPHLPTPAAPHRYPWPGIGFLVASGLVQLALNGRVVYESMRSLFRRGEGAVDEDPIMSSKTLLVLGAVAVLFTTVFAWAALDLSPFVVLILVVVGGFLQNVIATRAAAQTAFNPARVMGVLLQSITALAGAPTAAANLAGAGMVAGSGAQAGNLAGDLVYGRALHVPARHQFFAQMATILPCSLVSAWVFTQLSATSALSLEGEGLPAPVAKMWAATAMIFDGRTEMPPFAWQAMGIGALVGGLYVLLERNRSLETYLPHSIGIGIGLVLPVAYDLSFFVGGVLLYGLGERVLGMRHVTLTTIAVAAIVAEGLGGVLKPVLSLLGVIRG